MEVTEGCFFDISLTRDLQRFESEVAEMKNDEMLDYHGVRVYKLAPCGYSVELKAHGMIPANGMLSYESTPEDVVKTLYTIFRTLAVAGLYEKLSFKA